MSTEHLLGDVGGILEGLIGTDNQQRQQAETHLDRLAGESPGPLLVLLAQIGAQGVGGFQLDQRLLALILLRRLAFTEHAKLTLNAEAQQPAAPFDVVPEQTRSRIERILGAGLEDEMDVRLRKGLGVCVGEWVKASERRRRPFQSLPEIILRLASSTRPFHRFSPFQLLNTAPGLLSEGTSQPVPAQKVAELLLGGINDSSVDVVVEAFKATRGVLHDGMSAPDRDMYGPGLVAAIFEVTPRLPLDTLEQALEPVIDVASSFPHLFTPSLGMIVPFLVMCVAPPNTLSGHSFSRFAHQNMEWDAWCNMSNMAYEVLFSLMIANPAASQLWEGGNIVPDVVSALIGRQVGSFAAEGEACQDWVEMEGVDEDDETYPSYTEEMLGRFSQIIKEESVLHAVARQASELLGRKEWRAKYCSLMAIASISEGCYESMEVEAEGLLKLIAPASAAEHPRVRYGFLWCIGKLCQNLSGTLQHRYADATLEILMRLLDDPIPRVRVAAAAAMVHFFEPEDLPSFEGRLQPILERLVTTLQRGPLYVQEEVLATIAAVAGQSGAAFRPFYREIMDFNLQVLRSNTDSSQETLVGRCMRCAAVLGKAVGKQTFFPDAVPVCQALLVIQNQITEPEDKRRAYLSEAWAMIAPVLGTDFAPFLPLVLPAVLAAAAYQPPYTEDEEEAYDQTHSAEMVEKEEAFVQLSMYVSEMRGAYSPFLEETMAIALDGIQSASDGVREAACFLVPGLLQVAKDAKIWVSSDTNLASLFRTLINAIPHQYEAAAVGQIYQSIGDSLRVLEVPLPEVNVHHLVRSTISWLSEVYEGRIERAAEATANRTRGDFWLWAEEQQYEQSAEDEALVCMDTAFGRVVKHNSGALGALNEISQLAQKVKGAAVEWSE